MKCICCRIMAGRLDNNNRLILCTLKINATTHYCNNKSSFIDQTITRHKRIHKEIN